TALLLVLLVAMRKASRQRTTVVLLMSGGLVTSLASVGHGSIGEDRMGLLHLVSDAAHALCATAWIGALAGFAVLLHRAIADRDQGAIGIIPKSVQRFSRFGYGVVGVLLVTGSVNAAILVASPQALLATDYGQALLIKVGLVLAMLVIAARNRFSLATRFDRGDEASRGAV